jgi:hypothetical protein
MAHTGRTPRARAQLWQKRLLGGYDLDPAEALGEGFDDPRRDMVVVRGIACTACARTTWCRFAASPMSPTCRAGGCTASAASPAWWTPSATASPTRNG